jgi:hypothetical protein
VLQDLSHFQDFIASWHDFSSQKNIQWSIRRYRDLGEQNVPEKISFNSLCELLQFLGEDIWLQVQSWQKKCEILASKISYSAVYSILIELYEEISKLSMDECATIAKLLPQLHSGMGQGQYLRALAFIDIDSKFLESHMFIIENLLNVLHADFSIENDLYDWLGCKQNPKNWLTIFPLDPKCKSLLAGLAILQLPAAELMDYPLPAENILVVENMQSGLGLPPMENTIAVIGCGRNIAWLYADWLKSKKVMYWGDIDTWGLTILSEARELCNNIQAIMMDGETFNAHLHLLTIEPTSNRNLPASLTDAEQSLFKQLSEMCDQPNRLEQERLPQAYVLKNVLSICC